MSLRHTPSRVSDDDKKSAASSYTEYVEILARRILFSRLHSTLCATVLGASVIEVLWIVLPSSASGWGHMPNHWLFFIVESYVTLGLMGEIALRVALERRAFFDKRSNIFDTIVAVVSVIVSLLYTAGLETAMEFAAAEALVTLRIVFRLLRLLSLTKGFKRHRQAADRKMELEVKMELVGADDEETPPISPVGLSEASHGLGTSYV